MCTHYNKKTPKQQWNARNAGNLAALRASVADNANVSVKRRSQEGAISMMST